MDRNVLALNTPSDDFDATDKKRLDSFRLGGAAPRTLNRRSAPILHARSHSRNHSSVSSIPSAISLPHVPPSSMNDSPPTSPNALSSSKRNSHHRRRSSVSTRHESAELMGFTLPTVPISLSDDNINLGDKDSIRRRALLTLEGKTDVGSFARVEIPELGPSEIKKSFDFPSKPSFPPGTGASFGNGLSTMTSKRDSIGKFAPSTSSKEQLGTLMEEEEEEEDENTVLDMTVTSSPVDELPVASVEVAATSLPSAPFRPRPASLNLRPLSLVSAVSLQTELPTPSPSPSSAVPRAGLRSLTLGASSHPDAAKSFLADASPTPDPLWKRRSAVFIPSSAPAATPRLTSLNTTGIQVPPPIAPAVSRRSSISYYSSGSPPDVPSHGLPTPEMTPVSDRRQSAASTDSSGSRHSSRGSRPLSISEQHFLFQAHQTLVQRISDLERALSARPRSRPQSCASDASSQSEVVSDEMLQLIADLKAERDELKKDVDGWRNRIADSEKQMSLLFRRIENERREAWVARERVGLMEVEKRAVEKTLEEKMVWGEEGWQKFRVAQDSLDKAQEECKVLRAEAQDAASAREEILKLKTLLDAETRKREELEKDMEGLLATPTPRAFEIAHKPSTAASRTMMFAKRGGLGFRSIDSVGSFTDVESEGSVDFNPKMLLKAVAEEDEGDSRDETMSEGSAEENGLASYEDEEDIDHYAFHDSSSASSMGSVNEFSLNASASAEHSDAVPSLSTSQSSTPSPARPASPQLPAAHDRHRSLSRAWTFPQEGVSAATPVEQAVEVDRFFNCLEDLDDSPPMASLESGKTLFSKALADDDDELPPFVLPSGFGIEVFSPEIESKSVLDVVVEEDEEEDEAPTSDADDDFVGEEVEGGIIFTFNPPPSFSEPEPPTETPDLSHDTVSTPDSSFTEDCNRSFSSSLSASSIASPSSIPRLVSTRKSMLPTVFPMSSTPIKSSWSMDSFQTPPPASSTPIKRGGSPAEVRRSASPATPSKLPQPSFIPQPRRANPAKAAPTRATTSPKQRPSSMIPSLRSPPSRLRK
ncbi:hypothetical protein EIP91_003226 [Steccherinum ochraceum]|uniref:Uncharacterized protein n=1 Tax=Steccherinum ochraceum TaxID=92696 RepID=A0A4R0RV03_9APHY|nr:hypothetical protein EIP91_003226 [Steccherinum ochraceum]